LSRKFLPSILEDPSFSFPETKHAGLAGNRLETT
jgi:hypothetical protein